MNDKEILLLTHEKSLKFAQHLAHVFNYQLNETSFFGQTKHPKKNFYVPGRIHAISTEKVYTKTENEIILISRANGQKLKTFKAEFEIEHLLIDTVKDRIIVHTHANQLEMFDETGTLLIKKQLNVHGVSFEECQLTDGGYFCFVNNDLNQIIII